jgi:hydrogenase expression/formation protein HypD
MKYVDDYRDATRVATLAAAIARITTRPWTIMDVCGSQTNAIVRYRLEELLPDKIRLLHGPGCPVCVTPESAIDRAIYLANTKDVILAVFGDMVRVSGTYCNLQEAAAVGADVRTFYSPLDAVKLAARELDRRVVFFAVGFETTIPVHLTAVREAMRLNMDNFSLLTAFFTVPAAIQAVLTPAAGSIDGFLTAGHVCAVTGNQPYHALAEKFRKPMVVTGFEPADLLYGIYRCILQLESGLAAAEIAYKRAVNEHGNSKLAALFKEMLEPVDAEWRGLGIIPDSGLRLRPEFGKYDAGRSDIPAARPRPADSLSDRLPASQPQCITGDIMRGIKQVGDCPHFAAACTPDRPMGPSMVSEEGVCAAYFRYNSQ